MQNLHSTIDFLIDVQTRFMPERSQPEQQTYAFAYTVTIRNTGSVAAQLVSRRWTITNAMNHIQEVRGLGVVGQQPFLQPGQTFEYQSWAVLTTPVGSMQGSYFFVTENDERIDWPIPEFALVLATSLH